MTFVIVHCSYDEHVNKISRGFDFVVGLNFTFGMYSISQLKVLVGFKGTVMQITAKLEIIEMRNFQDTFKTLKRSFISAFSIWMTVPLKKILKKCFHL